MSFITHDQFDIAYWKEREVPFTHDKADDFYDFDLEGRWPDKSERNAAIDGWNEAKMKRNRDLNALVDLSGEGVTGLHALLHQGERSIEDDEVAGDK